MVRSHSAVSAFCLTALLSLAGAPYFDMVNEKGGVNGR
jgi:hypothetical protein